MSTESVELLMKVLAIRSVNGRDDEGAVAEFLADYMRRAGIDARTVRIDGTHANVTARIGDITDGETVVWNGHLDTVPYGAASEWRTDPAVPTVAGGRIYGRGASDMKSGLCAMVFALCEAVRLGRPFRHPVFFCGTCDEEKNGIGARALLKEEGMTGCGRILIGEPTGLKAGTAQKGCLWLRLDISGKTSHGAYPGQGRSAVEFGLRAADEIRAFVSEHEHALLGRSTAIITRIEGGVAPNMVPDRCMIRMDIRFTPDLDRTAILKKAEEAAAEAEAATNGDVRISLAAENYRRAIETAPGDAFVTELETALRAERIPFETTGINFCTDASILAENDPDTSVILFGPGEPFMAHKPNEYVEIEKYEKAIRVLGRMI